MSADRPGGPDDDLPGPWTRRRVLALVPATLAVPTVGRGEAPPPPRPWSAVFEDGVFEGGVFE